MTYYTYLLRCGDGSLYCGITTDLARRLREHTQGRGKGGARYTALRGAVGFAAAWQSPDRAAAASLENRIKRLDHRQKELLIADGSLAGLELSAYTPAALPEE